MASAPCGDGERPQRRGLGFRRIAVCLSPSVPPAGAVAIACALVAERGRLIAIAAIEVALELPLDAPHGAADVRAREAIETARAIAASYRVPVKGVVLHARDAGEAIVAEVGLERADLVVIAEGATLRRNTSRLSRTTDYVLNHANSRVMLIAGGATPAAGDRPGGEAGPRFRSDRPSDYWPSGEFVDRASPRDAAVRGEGG